MLPPRKHLLRLASRIQSELERHSRRWVPIELPHATWDRCQRLDRQLRLAHQRQWSAAARQRRDELHTALNCMRAELIQSQQPLADKQTTVASPREMVLDLAALDQEFASVQWSISDGTLSVTTDAIELDDRQLGPFRVVLEWQRLDAIYPYRVVAVDPQPALRDNTVTHPHVQDEILCEGEGKQAIRAALASGRLYDFFCLIANVLGTYNAASAYVDLHEWNASTCNDCGSSCDADDCLTCSRCEDLVCRECGIGCDQCGDSCCSDCTDACVFCCESLCHACLGSCRQCEAHSCPNCLTDSNLCERCHDQEEAPLEPASVGTAT